MTASIGTFRNQGAAGECQVAVLDETIRFSTLQDKAAEIVHIGARSNEHFSLAAKEFKKAEGG